MTGKTPSALNELRKFCVEASIAASRKFIPIDMQEKIFKCGQLMAGFRHIQNERYIHGDIKPENWLANQTKAVVADLGGSSPIASLIQLMRPNFALNNEAEKNQMRILVDALISNDDSRIAQARTNQAAQFQKLIDWELVSIEIEPVGCCGTKKQESLKGRMEMLRGLQTYLKTTFLPEKSAGYACRRYVDAMSDYFWRCEPENFERACLAFDQRAMGLALYVFLATADLPLGQLDTPLYYETIEPELVKKGVDAQAAALIRRMAEPLPLFDTTSRQLFPIPLTPDLLKQLEELLKKRL